MHDEVLCGVKGGSGEPSGRHESEDRAAARARPEAAARREAKGPGEDGGIAAPWLLQGPQLGVEDKAVAGATHPHHHAGNDTI